ncbi:MAG: hypothetical protein JXR34_05700 [Bacteroidales bacterium]|nr:hypothetical protein [Bacteroidales bacterium]
MKGIIEKILIISGIALMIFLMGFSTFNHQNRLCTSLNIRIDYGQREFTTNMMLTPDDINSLIRMHFDSIEGKKLKDINIEQIHQVISANNYVKDINVSQEINGTIDVVLTQRRPIIRIFGISGNSFYIDETGTAIPVKSGYPVRVVIASGAIDDRFFEGENVNLFDTSQNSTNGIDYLRNLYKMAKYLDKDDFLRKEITQINILPDGKINLIPLVGSHIIEMHSFDTMDHKLRKLGIFYKKAINQGGWGKYSKINIEYKNQIVCTKI